MDGANEQTERLLCIPANELPDIGPVIGRWVGDSALGSEPFHILEWIDTGGRNMLFPSESDPISEIGEIMSHTLRS